MADFDRGRNGENRAGGCHGSSGAASAHALSPDQGLVLLLVFLGQSRGAPPVVDDLENVDKGVAPTIGVCDLVCGWYCEIADDDNAATGLERGGDKLVARSRSLPVAAVTAAAAVGAARFFP